ncbi:unnamed protein product [Adineta ricciae]|uniref:F-box domain-containing protein n=1 Tax=Adineta ricciae TaxID=249248 RepID=A0A814AQG8_ADIRI|nr:unnamed protein product [Adineta ricciae]CAF1255401.1 unnamed protein product [Adineta ricciae]
MAEPSISTLESLPNEVLFNLFEYFDAQELYRSFYHLNSHWNCLLQSLSRLSLMFRTSDINSFEKYHQNFPSQIHTLMIYSQDNIEISQFFNLRNLLIWSPTAEQILQINTQSFRSIVYLYISFTILKPSISSLYEKIFSNGFPSLKFCYLCGLESPENNIQWSQSPNLQYLHTSSNPASILNSSPNLSSLILDLIILDDKSLHFNPHFNLRRLKLVISHITWLDDTKHLTTLFTLLPNLERLSYHKTYSITNSLDILLSYDWLGGILMKYLPLLKRFIYHLRVCNLFSIDQTEFNEHRSKFRDNFFKIFPNRSKYSFRIN